MSHVIISRLKFQVKTSAATGSSTAKKIQSLRFVPGAGPKTYKELAHTPDGCTREEKAAHRAARKALRNPASGPGRHSLWVTKRKQGEETRSLLLAYGFLRGLPYSAMERKARDGVGCGPSMTRIAYHINSALTWGKANLGIPYTEITVDQLIMWWAGEESKAVAA